MDMVSAVGGTGLHSAWDGDGTLDGVHLGLSDLDGAGALTGAGALLGMEVTDLGVAAGMAAVTGVQDGMETVTGAAVTGVIQDLTMLLAGPLTETIIIRVVLRHEVVVRPHTTVLV